VIIAAFLMGLATFGLSLLKAPGMVVFIIVGAMLMLVISLPIMTRRVMQRRRRPDKNHNNRYANPSGYFKKSAEG